MQRFWILLFLSYQKDKERERDRQVDECGEEATEREKKRKGYKKEIKKRKKYIESKKSFSINHLDECGFFATLILSYSFELAGEQGAGLLFTHAMWLRNIVAHGGCPMATGIPVD